MKKILLGIFIGVLLLAGGCVAMVGGAANSASDAITEMENEAVVKDEKYNDIVKNIKWEVVSNGFSTSIVGILENTLDEEISYIQLDYKTFDASGVVLDKSFTNETDITVGEKRKVEIMLINNEFDTYEITAKSSAL